MPAAVAALVQRGRALPRVGREKRAAQATPEALVGKLSSQGSTR